MSVKYTINYNTKNTKTKAKNKQYEMPKSLYAISYDSIELKRKVYQYRLFKTNITENNLQRAIDTFVLDAKENSMSVIEYKMV